MGDYARGNEPADEDRLPWLEAVEDEDARDGVSTGKLVALAVAALIALAIVLVGVWLLRGRATNAPAQGDPKLIAAQPGDYKVRPANPGGMKVEGKGDSSYAASEGVEANGRIASEATPEAPLRTVRKAAPAAPQPPARPAETVAVPKAAGPLVAKLPVAAAKPAPGTVQLGAFDSAAIADTAWASLTRRVGGLSELRKSVQVAQVGGRTVYRLRTEAGDAAAEICAKVRAAGGNCLRVN